MARQHRSTGGGPSEPSPTEQEPGPDAEPESVARTICLRLLTIRARTRAELEDALQARDVPAAAARSVLDRLAAVGLIDDRAFADRFVESRHHERGLAGRAVARQLRDKGVADEVVAEAVQAVGPEQELATARRLVARKLRTMSRLEPQVQTRRLAGLLARKGYSPEIAFRVVREAVDTNASQIVDGDEAWLA